MNNYPDSPVNKVPAQTAPPSPTINMLGYLEGLSSRLFIVRNHLASIKSRIGASEILSGNQADAVQPASIVHFASDISDTLGDVEQITRWIGEAVGQRNDAQAGTSTVPRAR